MKYNISSGSCPVKFVWDYGGKDVHVCILQNGAQSIVQLKKSNDQKFFEADAKLLPGRCEFRFELILFWILLIDLIWFWKNKLIFKNLWFIQSSPKLVKGHMKFFYNVIQNEWKHIRSAWELRANFYLLIVCKKSLD